MKNVVAGFKVCGVCPFNRMAFDIPEEEYTSFKPEALLQKSGLKYIPLYSPIRCRADPSGSTTSPTSPLHFSTPTKYDDSSFSDSVEDSLAQYSVVGMQHSHSDSSLYDRSILTQTPDQSKCTMLLRRATS